jgi:hypothetical protein
MYLSAAVAGQRFNNHVPIRNNNYISVALILKRTMPTERLPLLGKVSANFCGLRVSHGQRNGSLRPYSRISKLETIRKNIRIEERRFLACGALWIYTKPTFRKNLLPPSSG